MNQDIFHKILIARGLDDKTSRRAFLNPDYSLTHNPYLLPDMEAAVERIKQAKIKKETVVVYGDYDIDGLSATTLLLDSLEKFGLDISAFIPSRFDDGYGLSESAIESLADNGAQLIITVDCGSLSHVEIAKANELGVDVIVTDHHSVGETMPNAAAVINPKRKDSKYPFKDLAGVGVAFKLVQALQKEMKGLEAGQEKWLLDLVALGTICDIVELKDENRILAYWGLKVLTQTRRLGLKALLAVAGVKKEDISARTLGYVLGPRLNASGRLETAQHSLDLLTAEDANEALYLAQQLDAMNTERRIEQKRIIEAAKAQAQEFHEDPVLVLSAADWSHGIIGIVAAKILEEYKKPTFVLQEIDEETKGSARSFGDFSAVEAIRSSEQWIVKGGGHTFAAGVTLKTKHIVKFRESVNDFYFSQGLENQERHLAPKADVMLESFEGINEELIRQIATLEPFGNGNPEPVFCFEKVKVVGERLMGDKKQHIKLQLEDSQGNLLQFLAFSAPEHYFGLMGEEVKVWCKLTVNEWRSARNIEGRLLDLTNS